MPLPLIPIVAGTAGVAAGAALHSWLTSNTDAWADKTVFNARMRDMQGLAESLQAGFAKCPALLKNQADLTSWRTTRDGFSRFYGDVGAKSYFSPSDEIIEQAKSYASRLYFWVGEYTRLGCGPAITPTNETDPYAPPAPNQTDWATVAKWAAIGITGAFVAKTLAELFDTRR